MYIFVCVRQDYFENSVYDLFFFLKAYHEMDAVGGHHVE
jgi:hypothetical protein